MPMFKVSAPPTERSQPTGGEFHLRDRLTWMRFLDFFGPGDPVPTTDTTRALARP